MYKDIKFIAERVIVIIRKSRVTKEKKKREEIELNVSFKFCFETGFKKDIVPFGINYFGSCAWLIISTAFKISLKQTYFAHTHPPLKICLLSPCPRALRKYLMDCLRGSTLGGNVDCMLKMWLAPKTCINKLTKRTLLHFGYKQNDSQL